MKDEYELSVSGEQSPDRTTEMNQEYLFWNVDTQKDFMYEGGALPVQGAEGIVPELKKLTYIAKTYGIQVVNTADWHNENTEEISAEPDFVNTFPEHCMSGTEGSEYIPETTPENAYVIDWQNPKLDKSKIAESRNILVYKDKFNAFDGNEATQGLLEALTQKEVVVYGVATDVCVYHAVTELLERGREVTVVRDAIKDLEIRNPEEIIKEWEEKGATITTTKDLTNRLELQYSLKLPW